MIVLGLMVHFGLIQSTTLFLTTTFASMAGLGFAWLCSMVMVIERRMDRQSLAASVERDNDFLLDRLNTVVELDQRREDDPSAAMYRDAIENQAAAWVDKLAPASPMKNRSVVIHFVVMLLLATLTLSFYSRTSPLQTLSAMEAGEDEDVNPVSPLTIPETSPPANDQILEDQRGDWGEIRISEPGRDLRITVHEDVPMLIEAASDRPLDSIAWQTRVNDAEAVTRSLPELKDPRYAVFQPTLSPEELGLAVWDVARYHAIANGIDETRYKSSSYFVEIVPGSDTLANLPETGYRHLEQLTDLIHQQQQVIRNTEKLTDPQNTSQQKIMDSMAERQQALASEGRALQKKLTQLLDPKVLQDFNSSIEAADVDFATAETALRERTQATAEQKEDSALMHLAAARRELSELINQHPAAFESSALDELKDRPAITATEADPEIAKLLEKILQEKNQADQVSQAIADLLDQQTELQNSVQQRDQPPTQDSIEPNPAAPGAIELGNRQQQISDQFTAIRDQFPNAFRDLQGLSNQTSESLSDATEKLLRESDTDGAAVKHARNKLQELSSEFEKRAADHELFQSQNLQERIAKNREAYREITQTTETIDASKIADTTAQTEELLKEIPDTFATAENRTNSNSPQEKPQQNPDDGDESQNEQADQPSKTNSMAETKQDITSQANALKNTADNDERSAIANDLVQSLGNLADVMKQETLKSQQSLNQKQMATELQQLQNQSEALQNARDFVQQAMKREETIQKQAAENATSKTRYQSLASDQIELEEDMTKARQKNPDGFQSVTSQCDKVQQQMQQAMRSLNAGQNDAPMVSKQAAESLQQLDESLARQQQASEAAKQQQIASQMQELIARLDKMEKKPDDFSRDEKKQTAGQCQSVGSMACQNPGSSGSGGQGSASPTPSETAPDSANEPPTAGPSPGSKPSPDGPRTASNNTPSSDGGPSDGGQGSPAESPSKNESAATTNPPSGTTSPPGTDVPSGLSGTDVPSGLPGTDGPRGESGPQQALKQATERLANSEGTQETSDAAGGLKEQMQSLAEAMGLQPGPGMKPGMGMKTGMGMKPGGQKGQAAAKQRQGDSLRPGGQESLNRGLAQLESAARQGQQGTLKPGAARSLRNSGLADIVRGIQNQHGYNESSQVLIQQVKKEIDGPKVNIDLKTVNRLRDQIQQAQRDLVIKPETPEETIPVLRNDSRKYPSAYRESIQKYFQTLSEDKPQ